MLLFYLIYQHMCIVTLFLGCFVSIIHIIPENRDANVDTFFSQIANQWSMAGDRWVKKDDADNEKMDANIYKFRHWSPHCFLMSLSCQTSAINMTALSILKCRFFAWKGKNRWPICRRVIEKQDTNLNKNTWHLKYFI